MEYRGKSSRCKFFATRTGYPRAGNCARGVAPSFGADDLYCTKGPLTLTVDVGLDPADLADKVTPAIMGYLLDKIPA